MITNFYYKIKTEDDPYTGVCYQSRTLLLKFVKTWIISGGGEYFMY